MTTTMGAPDQQVGDHLRARVTKGADECEQIAEQLAIARDRRDEAIVAAVEGGASTREVARWARLAQSRIGKILSEH